jgi:hypothetical protein
VAQEAIVRPLRQNNTLRDSEFPARCTADREQDIRMSFDVALVAPITFPT